MNNTKIITLNVMLSVFPYVPLLKQVFKTNYINDGIVVHCLNASQVILLQKLFHNSDVKILPIKADDFHEYHFTTKLGIVLDTSCQGWTEVFKRHSNSSSRHQLHWLINTSELHSTTKFLSRNPLQVNSDIILIYNNGSNNYNLYESYNTGFNSKGMFVVRKIGIWNSTLYLRKLWRTDLKGVELKCISVITENLVNETYKHFLMESRHDKPDTLNKLKFFTVFRYLQDMYNFSLNVERTNSWGYYRNGSFDGLVGALQRQEAEFGCSPVLFKKNRAEVVNYVIPTWQTKHTFLFRQPKYKASYCSVYTRPLDGTVWCCLLAVLMIEGFILNVIFRIKTINTSASENDTSLSLIWLLICSAVCQQGMPVARKTISGRIIIFVTFMFSMVVYQFYNANVLSSLLNEQYNNIRNLEDLLESDLKAGVEDMLFNKDYFKRTTDPIPLELYKRKIATDKYKNFFDAEYGMSWVKLGGFAFHVDTSAAYRIMRSTFSEREICEVGEVPLFPPQYVGAVAKVGSQYREYIAVGVSKMLESGLMSRIQTVWDSRKPPCTKMRYSNIIAVSLREFSMALMFLACGFTVALIVLFFEIIFTSKIKQRKVMKRKPHRENMICKVHLEMYKTFKRMKRQRIKYCTRKLLRNRITL